MGKFSEAFFAQVIRMRQDFNGHKNSHPESAVSRLRVTVEQAISRSLLRGVSITLSGARPKAALLLISTERSSGFKKALGNGLQCRAAVKGRINAVGIIIINLDDHAPHCALGK